MSESKAKLIIRNAVLADAPAVAALSRRVYGEQESTLEAHVRGQINNFPEGQFVAEYEGRIIGYCATFIIDEKRAMEPHSWSEITGGGFAARHNPDGLRSVASRYVNQPQRRRRSESGRPAVRSLRGALAHAGCFRHQAPGEKVESGFSQNRRDNQRLWTIGRFIFNAR